MSCTCTKEKILEQLKSKDEDLQLQIHNIQLKDVEKEKDIEKFQESLDKLNATLDELKVMIEKLNDRPLKKYEKVEMIVLGGILGAIVSFFMNILLG